VISSCAILALRLTRRRLATRLHPREGACKLTRRNTHKNLSFASEADAQCWRGVAVRIVPGPRERYDFVRLGELLKVAVPSMIAAGISRRGMPAERNRFCALGAMTKTRRIG